MTPRVLGMPPHEGDGYETREYSNRPRRSGVEGALCTEELWEEVNAGQRRASPQEVTGVTRYLFERIPLR